MSGLIPGSDVLCAIAAIEGEGETATIARLVARLERRRDNVQRSLKIALADQTVEVDGETATLTDKGRRIVLAEQVAEAGAGAPTPSAAGAPDVIRLRWDEIEEDPENPRTDLDTDEARDSVENLRALIVLRGEVMQPVRVRPRGDNGKHRLVFGARRLRAVGRAIEDGDLPEDFPVPATVRDYSPDEALVAAVEENVARQDMHPLDEAEAYRKLVRVHGWSTQAVADRFEKSQKTIQDRIAVVEKLDDATKARMRLPADDPDHLTYKTARQRLRDQGAAAQAEDLEAKLSPKALCALVEIAAKVERGPQLQDAEGAWTTARGSQADLIGVELLRHKLISSRPMRHDGDGREIRLTRPGARMLERLGYQTESGHVHSDQLDQIRIAAHGRTIEQLVRERGTWATSWLNPPPRKPETAQDAELYQQAVAVVSGDRNGSTSYLQRKLGLGYNKAASLLERMEREGIVGPPNHAGKRDVLAPPPEATAEEVAPEADDVLDAHETAPGQAKAGGSLATVRKRAEEAAARLTPAEKLVLAELAFRSRKYGRLISRPAIGGEGPEWARAVPARAALDHDVTAGLTASDRLYVFRWSDPQQGGREVAALSHQALRALSHYAPGLSNLDKPIADAERDLKQVVADAGHDPQSYLLGDWYLTGWLNERWHDEILRGADQPPLAPADSPEPRPLPEPAAEGEPGSPDLAEAVDNLIAGLRPLLRLELLQMRELGLDWANPEHLSAEQLLGNARAELAAGSLVSPMAWLAAAWLRRPERRLVARAFGTQVD